MEVLTTPLAGVLEVVSTPVHDERGFFLRSFCRSTFAAHGIDLTVAQRGTSFNHRRGTLRGMHFQRAPHAETKLVRCTRGAAFDVALDLRPGSATYGRWHGTTLSADNHRGLLIPPGVAHGFLTLEEGTEIDYLLAPAYEPSAADGVRWDDPAFAIAWPFTPAIVSARDRSFAEHRAPSRSPP